MSGTTLFLLGAIAISNISLLVYLLSDRNKNTKSQKTGTTSANNLVEPSIEQTEKKEVEIGRASCRERV